MFDFSSLTNYTENPPVLLVLLTVLFSFFLSGLIVFTYEMTTRGTKRPDNFIQSLLLVSIVACTVIQAIGDSLARGLGMLGALSIIRFRTTLRNPRNMVFMFSSLATGIACGVYGFEIAFLGTIGFCLVAFLLYFTPFSKNQNLVGALKFEIDRELGDERRIFDTLHQKAKHYALTKYTVYNRREDLPDGEVSTKKNGIAFYEYSISLKKQSDSWDLTDSLYELPGVKNVRLSFSEQDESELI